MVWIGPRDKKLIGRQKTSTLPPGRRLCRPAENAIGLPPGRTTMSGNGYPRKGQKSKPKRQNQARERKERKKKSKSNQVKSQPQEVDLERASKIKPKNLNCQKWAHPYPPSRPG
ncbi:hypothetical protein Tco_1169024, partial [Tanacetum coccineum]